MERLFIGGLNSNISSEDLNQRFKSFGEIKNCEIIKKGQQTIQQENTFAYIDIIPKNNDSILELINLFNNSFWKGQNLRVERAKPSFLKILQAERSLLKLSKQLSLNENLNKDQNEPKKALDLSMNVNVKNQLIRIDRLGCGNKRRYFRAVETIPLSELEWEMPEVEKKRKKVEVDQLQQILKNTAINNIDANENLVTRREDKHIKKLENDFEEVDLRSHRPKKKYQDGKNFKEQEQNFQQNSYNYQQYSTQKFKTEFSKPRQQQKEKKLDQHYFERYVEKNEDQFRVKKYVEKKEDQFRVKKYVEKNEDQFRLEKYVEKNEDQFRLEKSTPDQKYSKNNLEHSLPSQSQKQELQEKQPIKKLSYYQKLKQLQKQKLEQKQLQQQRRDDFMKQQQKQRQFRIIDFVAKNSKDDFEKSNVQQKNLVEKGIVEFEDQDQENIQLVNKNNLTNRGFESDSDEEFLDFDEKQQGPPPLDLLDWKIKKYS